MVTLYDRREHEGICTVCTPLQRPFIGPLFLMISDTFLHTAHISHVLPVPRPDDMVSVQSGTSGRVMSHLQLHPLFTSFSLIAW